VVDCCVCDWTAFGPAKSRLAATVAVMMLALIGAPVEF
jgi:hypothetical protein